MTILDTFETAVLARPFPQSYWVVPGRLLAGEYPGSRSIEEAHSKISALINLDINTFIDLTLMDDLNPYKPILNLEARRQGKSVMCLQMGFLDCSVPSRREMKQILDMIDLVLREGRNIYLHCWGGIGRTGTVVGCFLARHGTTGQAALDEIARLREVIPGYVPQSPETSEQRRMVLRWGVGE